MMLLHVDAGTALLISSNANQGQVIRVSSCSFHNNYMINSLAAGGQLYLQASAPETQASTGTLCVVDHCTFLTETTFTSLGSLFITQSYSALVTDNLVRGNFKAAAFWVESVAVANISRNVSSFASRKATQRSPST